MGGVDQTTGPYAGSFTLMSPSYAGTVIQPGATFTPSTQLPVRFVNLPSVDQSALATMGAPTFTFTAS